MIEELSILFEMPYNHNVLVFKKVTCPSCGTRVDNLLYLRDEKPREFRKSYMKILKCRSKDSHLNTLNLRLEK